MHPVTKGVQKLFLWRASQLNRRFSLAILFSEASGNPGFSGASGVLSFGGWRVRQSEVLDTIVDKRSNFWGLICQPQFVEGALEWINFLAKSQWPSTKESKKFQYSETPAFRRIIITAWNNFFHDAVCAHVVYAIFYAFFGIKNETILFLNKYVYIIVSDHHQAAQIAS